MSAGAVFSLVSGVLMLFSTAALRTAIRRAYPAYTPGQVRSLASAEITYSVMYTLVVVFLWLLIAWACRSGRAWARITGTVLFGLNTVVLLVMLLTRAHAGVLPHATAGSVMTALTWVAGLGAVVMLWQRRASAFFSARQT
jgi:hypothetical protein